MRWGLTQRELSPLLCIRHPTQLSRVERGRRVPSLESVLASCVVFGRDIEYLFPGLQDEMQERVVRAAYALYVTVEHTEGEVAFKKRKLLERIAELHTIPCK